MIISFNETMIVPGNWSQISDKDLEIKVQAFNQDMQVLKAFEWQVKDFGTRKMTIFVEFEYPERISDDYQGKDILSVKVIDPTKFLSADSLLTVEKETTTERDLPVQYSASKEEEIKKMEAQAEQIKNSSSVVMGGSFALNIVLAGSLSLLWGLINSLQLVTHFPLTNITFPMNAKTYFSVMFEIGNFDLIPTEQLEGYLDDEIGEADKSENTFDAEEVLSDSTIDAGYDTTNVVQSSFLNLILLSSIIGTVILIILLRLVCFKVAKVKSCLDKIWRMIFWNFIIRTLLETYLEVAIVNMIKIYAINDQSWFETSGSAYCLFILAVLTLFCLLTPVFLYYKRNDFKKPEFIDKYGSLVQDMRISEKGVLLYHAFFMARRFIFSMLIVFLSARPWA